MRSVYSVSAIVSQIRIGQHKAIWYLSDSGKGVKEVSGRITEIRKSVRGLSLSVKSDKGKTAVVAWKLPVSVVNEVLTVLSAPVPEIAVACPECGLAAGTPCRNCGCDVSGYLSAVMEMADYDDEFWTASMEGSGESVSVTNCN